ncbi:hypothetical protein OVY29_21930 [Sphingopyxis sp. SE2]|uniref:hypothetical protein n=1 Tax=Sphingopyxis sp. SE2 TaxID=1586240 RepID=UPI0028C31CA2|nr:hypothetical protein [Sphingopyxis sp. SE2]MDT7531321.1 hypothetical protein [Sphingopyxis sp. SE2]
MGKIILGIAGTKALSLGMTFAGIVFLLGLLPLIFSFIPGFGYEEGKITFNILQPLTGALANAPAMLRYWIHYTKMDLGLSMCATAAVTNLIWQVVKSAK